MGAADQLLFGLLALQNGLIDQSQLVAAFHAWTRDRARSLSDHLEALGHLDADQRAAIEAMVALHLRRHGGDAEKSLAEIPAGHSTRDRLAELGDPQIDASLRFAVHPLTEADPDSTTDFSIGSATSDGQRFRVVRPHARGGLGAVFVALDSELNREVALKQILDQHADDPVSRRRFLVEAEVTGSLEHPGVVPVYGLGTYADGRPFYAMRFIKGESLKDAVAAFHADETLRRDPGRRSLELRQLLRRFLDVCNAIEYAHSRGVLHRDLKPGNIIVGKYGETLVVDWGLAKATGKADPGADERTLMPSSASGSAETLPGSAIGTPSYMSPEQARGELEALGPRSDEYSLGATLYCLLTGRPPYEGDDLGELLRRVQNGEFPPPRQVDPAIDRSLEAVCLKAMAMRPEDRYPSCRALADDIERWLADEPVTARREPWRERASRWARKHPVATSAAAATLVMGLAAALYGLGRERTFSTSLAQANSTLDEQRLRAERQREELRRQNAVTNVKLALSEYENHNVAEADRHLDDCPPDLRFLEWSLVKRLCHREKQTLGGHKGGVWGMAFSPDGERIASGAGLDRISLEPGRGELLVRDAGTGRAVFERRGLRHGVSAVAFDPRGKGRYLATAGGLIVIVTGDRQAQIEEGSLDIWDIETGERRTLDQVKHVAVMDLAYSPDGTVLAAAYGIWATAGYVRLWDVATGKAIGPEFRGYRDGGSGVSFSPDGRLLAVAAGFEKPGDFRIEIWDWRRRVLAGPPLHVDSVFPKIAFSPDGRFLAGMDRMYLVRLWDVATGQEVRRFKGSDNYLLHFAFSPDGKLLASCGEDYLVRLWDVATGEPVEVLHGHPDWATAVAFDPEGRRLVSGDSTGQVKVWDVEAGQPVRFRTGGYSFPVNAEFHPDGRRLAVSWANEQHLQLWDAENGRLLRTFEVKGAWPGAIALSHDGSLLASCGEDRTARVWDVETGRQLVDLPVACPNAASGVAFHPRDRTRLITSCASGAVQLWSIDPARPAPLASTTLRRLGQPVGDVAYRPPLGRECAAALEGGSVHVWDIESGKDVATVTGLGKDIAAIAFNADGTLLAAAHNIDGVLPGMVTIYDMRAGRVRTTLRHTKPVHGVAFSPDGTRLALAAGFRVILWDVATGQEVLSIAGQPGGMMFATFSRDGHRLAAGGVGKLVRIWDIRPWVPAEDGR